MAATKKVFKYFTITQYEQEADWLRAQHRAGWKLVHVTLPGIYTLETCEPEDVVYQLDYNQEGKAHKAEYTQMFADCGWEYLFDFVGYSYFRKPAASMDGEESIFCDDESRLDMLQRVFMGRLLPLLIVFCCIIVPQLFLCLARMSQGNSFDVFLFALYCTLLGLYLAIFAVFGWQYLTMYHRVHK